MYRYSERLLVRDIGQWGKLPYVVFCVLVLCAWVVVGCGGQTAVSLTPTGPITQPQQQWQTEIGGGLAAPAQWLDGRLIVAGDTAVIALDAQTGAELWRVTPPHGVWSRSLAVGNGRVVIGLPGGLLALQASDGQQLWQQATTGELLWPPLVRDAVIYVGTAFVGPGIDPQPEKHAWVYALAADSGQTLWAVETDTYTLTTPVIGEEQMVIAGSFLPETAVSEGGGLRLHAFDRKTGSPLWTTDTHDGLLKTLALDAQHVYYLAYRDMLYALDGHTGAVVWHYPTENWSPGFTLADGRLYLGSDNAVVHAVSGSEGTAVWRVPLTGIFNSPRARPAIAGDLLYFQSNDNRLYALERDSGAIRWQTDPQPRSRVALTVGDGAIYLTGQDGVVYAYAATTPP